MNDKQKLIDEVLRIVVECCVVDVEGAEPVTEERVLGPDRCENVVMTRCIFATQMAFMGFSKTTTAQVLHRTEKSVGNMLQQAHQLRIQSFAYRLAEAQSTLKLKEIMLNF